MILYILSMFRTQRNKKVQVEKIGFINTLQLNRRETAHRLALKIKNQQDYMKDDALFHTLRFYKIITDFLTNLIFSQMTLTLVTLIIFSLLLFCYLFYFTNILFHTFIYTYTLISLSFMCV